MLKHRVCGTRGACTGRRACVTVFLVTLGMLLGVITPLHAQSLTWLGTLGGNQSSAYAVTPNGWYVAGSSITTSGYMHAFRWAKQSGMADGGPHEWNGHSSAYDISADGRILVGWADERYTRDPHAAHWEPTPFPVIWGPFVHGTLGGRESAFSAVSANGSIIVGWAEDASGMRRAILVDSTGMHDLGVGDRWSGASGVSADGSVVVGSARDPSGYIHTFRWENGVWQDLGALSGQHSGASDVSGDGSVVIGWLNYPGGGRRAFRWTTSGAMQILGTFGGQWSEAFGVSADGSVVVGWSLDSRGDWRAFRWQNGVMEDLNLTYADLLNGSLLRAAYGISSNGRYIVGDGWNAAEGRYEAYLLDTKAAIVTITGNVELRDFTGDVTQIPVIVELRQDGNVVGTRTLSLDPDGNYTLSVVLDTYDFAFKASHWLQVIVRDVVVPEEGLAGLDVSLINGDIDGDNEVTLFDFGALVAAFGSMPEDSNWNPSADLDGDFEVTLFDFEVLVRNFGAIGDE